jgi:CelD/BcsL family acetyltransferase involved in cellulose biosynthesis
MHSAVIRIITDLQGFESLSATWNSLLSKCQDDNSIFLTYEWLWTWWKHFGEGKKLNILLIEKEDQVIGIMPLMKMVYKIGPIKFHILETIGSTNCNYIWLTGPENRQEAITAVLAYLKQELVKNKLALRLTLVPEDSRFLNLLNSQTPLVSEELAIKKRIMTSAPYIMLPNTWDEYFRSLSHGMRERLRQASRSLEKSHNVVFKQFTADSVEEGLNRFFDLHQSRWQSVNIKGLFSTPKMKDFYRDIASQFMKRSWLNFSCLAVDNEMASGEYGFVYNGKYYALTAARDTSYPKYSVGHLHKMHLIKYAINGHLQEIDLLKGEEPYKFYWTKSIRRYVEVIVIKKGYSPVLRVKFLRAFLLLYQIRQYSLREIYSLYLIKRRERKEKKRMGLDKQHLL